MPGAGSSPRAPRPHGAAAQQLRGQLDTGLLGSCLALASGELVEKSSPTASGSPRTTWARLIFKYLSDKLVSFTRSRETLTHGNTRAAKSFFRQEREALTKKALG